MQIPKEVISVVKKLQGAGFEAYLVGGCVRDILQDVFPTDFDVATNAEPEEMLKIFKDSYKKGDFGTIGVRLKGLKEKGLWDEVEITTYRSETKYTDKRHPDKVEWARTIEEDLSRRDFTVNAMAIGLKGRKSETRSTKSETNSKFQIPNSKPNFQHLSSNIYHLTFNIQLIDPFNGQEDLKDKIIRAVGEPRERFSEDALRLMRAVRFAATLNSFQSPLKSSPYLRRGFTPTLSPSNLGRDKVGVWTIEPKTFEAIKENAPLIEFISKERIRDELIKILESKNAYFGFMFLHKTGLLKYIIPELEEGIGIPQSSYRPIYDVFKHLLFCLKYAAFSNFNLNVRLAALLHDIGKPSAKKIINGKITFYNHQIIGVKTAKEILSRLKFPRKTIEKVAILVRHHMFYYDPKTVQESSVRRLLREVGKENIEELIQLRTCDRKGSGLPNAKPYRLRFFEYILAKVSRQPISVSMLNIDGNEVMKILKIKPGPRVGLILNSLLAEVLDGPEKNEKKYLEEKTGKLGKMDDKKIQKMAKRIEAKKIEAEIEEKKKFHLA